MSPALYADRRRMRAAIILGWLAACGGGGGGDPASDGKQLTDGEDTGDEATACPSTKPTLIDLQAGFAADATHFYVTPTSTELARQPVTGGAAQKLADLPGTIEGPIVVGDTHVFGVAGGVAFRVAKTGGTAQSLGAVSGQVVATATDGAALYFVTLDDALELRSATTVNGPTTLLADVSADGVERLASDGAHVYWTTSQGGIVRRVPIGGGTVEDFADSAIDTAANTSSYGLGFDGDTVVWTAFYQALPNGRLFARPKTSGDRRELSHTGLFSGLGIAGDSLYVALTGDSTAIAKVPRAGGPREIIGCIGDRVFALTARDHGIYVTSNGEVLRFDP